MEANMNEEEKKYFDAEEQIYVRSGMDRMHAFQNECDIQHRAICVKRELFNRRTPPSPIELQEIIIWPKLVFANRKEWFPDGSEGEEEEEQEAEEDEYKGLEWHEPSCTSQRRFGEISAVMFCGLRRFMCETCGTFQDSKMLCLEQENAWLTNRDASADLALLEGLDLGWFSWRLPVTTVKFKAETEGRATTNPSDGTFDCDVMSSCIANSNKNAKIVEKTENEDKENEHLHPDDSLKNCKLPLPRSSYNNAVSPPLPPPRIHPPFDEQKNIAIITPPAYVVQASAADHAESLNTESIGNEFHAFWKRIKYQVAARTLAEDMTNELRAWLNSDKPKCNQDMMNEFRVYWKTYKDGAAARMISKIMPKKLMSWLDSKGKRQRTGSVLK